MPNKTMVMILGELVKGNLSNITREMLGGSRELADKVNGRLALLLLRDKLELVAEEAIAYGADDVYLSENPQLGTYQADTYLPIVEKAVQDTEPEILWIGQTSIGRDIAPRLAFGLSREKKIVFLVLGVVVVVGFLIYSAITIFKRTYESRNSGIALLTQRSVSKATISIELMEKIEVLKETVREDPKDLAAWLKLGDIYFDYNRYREATGAYARYLSIKPEDSDTRTKMGMMLRGLEDFDGAIEAFKKAAQLNPGHAESRFQLGALFLEEKKDVNGAISAWEDYLKGAPKSERANWVKAEIERLKMRKEVKE